MEEYVAAAPPDAPLTCPACPRPLSVDLNAEPAGAADGPPLPPPAAAATGRAAGGGGRVPGILRRLQEAGGEFRSRWRIPA